MTKKTPRIFFFYVILRLNFFKDLGKSDNMVDAFSMLATVMVGFFIGHNLDKTFDTSPLFTITLTFLGLGTTIFSVLKRK